jgi:hypothetical protein
MTATIYVVVDLDQPPVGLIRLDFADQAQMDAKASVK